MRGFEYNASLVAKLQKMGMVRLRVTICNEGVIPSTVTYNCKPYLNCVVGNGKVESRGKWRISERECRLSKLIRRAEDDMIK